MELHWIHFTKDPLQTFNQNEFQFGLVKADKLYEKNKPFISAIKSLRFGEDKIRDPSLFVFIQHTH